MRQKINVGSVQFHLDSSFIIFNKLYIAPIFLGSEVHYHDKAFLVSHR